MSWEEYEAFEVEGSGEYIDGEYVHMNRPTRRHQTICLRLAMRIDHVLPPEAEVLIDWAWKPTADQFAPDVMVYERTAEDKRLTVVPHLAVEVLSTDSAVDTIRKHRKYAEAGLPRYWIIDPDGPDITVYHLTDGALVEVARHERGTEATLDLGVATLTLDPADLLP
jgi:Uma2 family endonuclease